MTVPARSPLTRGAIFSQAWPIMLGQASVPLVGLVDTIVIGRTGNAAALAGVALGATVMNFVFWSFGFLRMGITGLTAQAEGAGDRDEVNALLLRGLMIAAAIGLALLALRTPVSKLAFALMNAERNVTALADTYVRICLFGGPAALAVFAITGWMFGLGRSRHALALQAIMNVANITISVSLVRGFHMGVEGVALGATGAQWIALAAGIALTSHIAGEGPVSLARRAGAARLFDRRGLLHMFTVNRDILIRTVALLVLFSWFARSGARLGAEALAANHVLLQFVNVAAFVLDAFAFTAEARVGNAIGAGSRTEFLRAIRLTGEFSLAGAALLTSIFALFGNWVIDWIAVDAAVRETAHRFLPLAALLPLVGMPSWLLDGIFIGATRGTALRNAGVAATLLYLGLDIALRPHGNLGVWIAFASSYILRAAALGLYFPGLLATVGQRDRVIR